MKIKSMAVTLIIVLILSFTGCTKKASEEEMSTVQTIFLMGTVVTVKVYGPDREAVAEKVVARLKDIEEKMSLNLPESEVSQVNANAGIKPVKVSDDTFEVIKVSLEFSAKTDGLFDLSVGPLVELWGIGSNHAKVPSKKELAQVLPLVNYKDILLNEEAKTVYLAKPGMIIDIGGIAKGYAADETIKIFQENGVKSGFVNLGGNVMVHGVKPDKSLWVIGIQDPRAVRDDLMATIKLGDETVVTSGDYERFIERNGVRYHHILNPKTGYPADAGLISTSIIGERSIIADALSTSTFLLGWEKGSKLAQSLGYEVMAVTKDKKILMTPGIKDKMEITNEEYKLK